MGNSISPRVYLIQTCTKCLPDRNVLGVIQVAPPVICDYISFVNLSADSNLVSIKILEGSFKSAITYISWLG